MCKGDKMKRLIIVRHGRYENGHLNEKGIEQIRTLSTRIKELVGGANVIVLSSPIRRAKESAQIIAGEVQGEVVEHDEFSYHNCDEEDVIQACEIVYEVAEKYENVVVVSHKENCGSIIEYFSKTNLSKTFPRILVNQGDAWVIDTTTNSIEIIR